MIVRDVFRKAKVPESKGVPGLRHLFVTQLLGLNGDLLAVRRFSRRRSVETLRVYEDRRELDSDLDEVNRHFADFKQATAV